MDSGTWKKSPPELKERFEAAVAGIEGLEVRRTLGYQARAWVERAADHVRTLPQKVPKKKR
jgi:hypothetical protein